MDRWPDAASGTLNFARHNGRKACAAWGETGRERYGGVLEVAGLCNILNKLSLFYFRFSSLHCWMNFNFHQYGLFNKHIYFQVHPFHVCSYRKILMTLNATNLSCNIKKAEGNLQGSVSARIKCKAATSTRRQLWSTALFDQRNHILLGS